MPLNLPPALKRSGRQILRRFGLDIVRCCDMPVRPFNVLRLVVENLLQSGSFVDFVQIGANDGVLNDPLHRLIKQYQLRGVLVEPVPDHFQKLKENYAGCAELKFECAAVARTDGTATLYRVRPDAPAPTWVQGLASFNRLHITGRRFGIPGLEKYVEALEVSTLTMQSLLAKHSVAGPTLLQVDTEGFDCEVVRMTLESGVRPIIINYEFCHVEPESRRQCKQLLSDCGYCFIDAGRDTVAVRSDHAAVDAGF